MRQYNIYHQEDNEIIDVLTSKTYNSDNINDLLVDIFYDSDNLLEMFENKITIDEHTVFYIEYVYDGTWRMRPITYDELKELLRTDVLYASIQVRHIINEIIDDVYVLIENKVLVYTDGELQFINCTPQYEKYMISITSKDKLLEEINNEVQ